MSDPRLGMTLVRFRQPALELPPNYVREVGVSSPDHWWKFDETTGTPFIDAVAGYDLSWSGSVTAGEPGAVPNSAASIFTNAGGYGYPSSGPVMSEDITVEAWCYISSLNSNDYNALCARKDSSSTQSFFLGAWWAAGGKMGFECKAAGNNGIATTAEPMNDGLWHHIVGVRRGTQVEIWADGVLSGTATCGSGPLDNQHRNFKVGQYGNYSSYRWRGGIDQLALYSRALPAEEIETHHQAALASMEA